MGTRCLTVVEDNNGSKLLTMYRQFDGYPDGHGLELSNFIEDMLVINGIPADAPEKYANGAGCLAAQIVSHFKIKPGGIYLYPHDFETKHVDYVYTITASVDDYPNVRCESTFDNELIFDGKASEFTFWANGD